MSITESLQMIKDASPIVEVSKETDDSSSNSSVIDLADPGENMDFIDKNDFFYCNKISKGSIPLLRKDELRYHLSRRGIQFMSTES